MKLYKYCLVFITLALLISEYLPIKTIEKDAQPYLFTIENKILNKKIYVSVYEQLGVSRWKRIVTPTSIDALKSHTFTLEKAKVEKKQYIYAIATEALVLSKTIISQQEKDALDALIVTSSKEMIDSTFFSAKNSFDLGSITFYNDYAHPLFIARYITNPSEKSLEVILASTIAQCNPKASITLPVPVGYKGVDVILLACQKSDDLKGKVNIEDATTKKLFIARKSFKDWKESPTRNHYKASNLFADDSLSIINDTAQDWIVSLYANQGEQRLQKISDSKPCKAKETIIYDKKMLSPISNYDYKPSLWIIFDQDNKKLSPLLSINHTLHSGIVSRSAKTVPLSRWFTQTDSTTVHPFDRNKKEEQSKSVTDETTPVSNDGTSALTTESLAQQPTTVTSLLTGSLDMQLSNVTSKDIFIALYKKDKKNYARRAASLKIAADQSTSLKFEEDELLAYSVSNHELISTLTPREWRTLNTQSDLKHFDEKELKIKETMFKNNSFNMMEITIENNSYTDIVVGCYKQERPGKLLLAGVVQKISKKDSPQTITENKGETSDSETPNPQELANSRTTPTPNFAIPYKYKGFIGYQNSFSENNISLMDTSIDTAFSFERNHLAKIDISEKESFNAQQEFTGNCIVIENDFNDRKWIALYTMYDTSIKSAESIAAHTTKKYIPYYERMKVVIQDNYFDTSLSLEPVQPYAQFFINTQTTYKYYLSDAQTIRPSLKDKDISMQQEDSIVPTKPIVKEPKKLPEKEHVEFEKPYRDEPSPKVFVDIKEEREEKPLVLKGKTQSTPLKESLCGEKQVRVNNHSGKDILIRFYYRGFLNTTPSDKEGTYNISNGQELCFNLPDSTYLSDRYLIIASEILDFKEKYSNKELNERVRTNKAFNTEKIKIINLNNF